MNRIAYPVASLLVIVVLLCLNTGRAEDEPATSIATQQESTESKPATIRWKFENDESITYEYSSSTHVEMSSDQDIEGVDPFDQKIDSESSGTLVFDPNNEGSAELTISVRPEAAKNNSDDSFSTSGPGAAQEIIEVKATYKSDGSIEAENERIADSVQSFLDMLFQMPEEADIKPGKWWEKELDYLSRQDDSIKGKITTTFIGWEKQGESQLAKFEFTMTISSHKSEGSAELNMEFNGKGVWKFDTSRGKLFSSSFNYSFNTKVVADIPQGPESDNQMTHMELTSNGNGKVDLKEKKTD